MEVALTPELEEIIAAKVDSGRYTSATAVVEDALRLLQEREAQREAFDEELGSRIARLDRGEFVTPEQLKIRLESVIADSARRRA